MQMNRPATAPLAGKHDERQGGIGALLNPNESQANRTHSNCVLRTFLKRCSHQLKQPQMPLVATPNSRCELKP